MQQTFKWIIRITAIVIVFCLPTLVMAQGPFPQCPDPNVPCPIDGGLSFLIAAGVGYGIKKVRDNKKQQQADKL